MRWILDHDELGLIDLESSGFRILQISNTSYKNNFGIPTSLTGDCATSVAPESFEGFCDIDYDDPNFDESGEDGILKEVQSKALIDALNNALNNKVII